MTTLEKTLDHIRLFLTRHQQTIAVAESVTSGNLQAVFSLAKDATLFFQGGITAYNLGQKTRHLDIDPIDADNTNCVSDRIAEGMAVRVRTLFCSDWGIAVTGYAAPVPEWNVRNRLYAYYAFAHRSGTVLSDKIELKNREMKKVQLYYVQQIVNRFDKHIHSL